jgi:hypothetical protein
MRVRFIYIAIWSLLLVSCEEYYRPELEDVKGLLVVEAHLTNDVSHNYVKLSKARNFYDTDPIEKVNDAVVELYDVSSRQSFRAIESTPGNFSFTRIPVPGKQYQLRIFHAGDVYESEAVLMPPIPSIDTLYTLPKREKLYFTNFNGSLYSIELSGREINLDAPISKSVEYYRFSWRSVIQWTYYPQDMSDPYFGWISRYEKDLFNIAGPKQFSISESIKNHPILFLQYNSSAYLDSLAQNPKGWIIIVDQYGISKESYDFHERLNKQFLAEGTLFDPVLTQVYGNLHCRNDQSKIVLGFFDLNSYRQYRYFLDLGTSDNGTVIQRQLDRFYDIPERGYVRKDPPVFWENYY